MGRWAQYRKRGADRYPTHLPPGPSIVDWEISTADDQVSVTYTGDTTGLEQWQALLHRNVQPPFESAITAIGDGIFWFPDPPFSPDTYYARVRLVDGDGNPTTEWSEEQSGIA